MNAKQRILTWVALYLLVASFCYLPWKVQLHSTSGHLLATHRYWAPIWYQGASSILNGAEGERSIVYPELAIEWFVLGVIYAGVYILIRDNKR